MTYLTYDIARSRMNTELGRAEARRSRRVTRGETIPTPGTAVFDAVGHGLIAIGTRLVSDPSDHRRDRHAA